MEGVDRLLREGGGVFRTEDALAAGLTRMGLSALEKSGRIERVAHGVYARPGEMYDELYVLQLRSSRLIFSFETALWLNGLTDRIPLDYSITLPSGAPPGRLLREDCRCHYVRQELFEQGLAMRRTAFGHEVRCYDSERTICDIVRNESKVGVETLVSALKAYVSSKGRDLIKLMQMARAFSIEGDMAKYMGVLT